MSLNTFIANVECHLLTSLQLVEKSAVLQNIIVKFANGHNQPVNMICDGKAVQLASIHRFRLSFHRVNACIYRGPLFISNANERFCWIICRYFEYSHRIYTLNLSTMEYDSIRWCRIIIEICAYLSKWSKFHSIGDVDMCLSLGKCECCVPLMCNIDGCSIF